MTRRERTAHRFRRRVYDAVVFLDVNGGVSEAGVVRRVRCARTTAHKYLHQLCALGCIDAENRPLHAPALAPAPPAEVPEDAVLELPEPAPRVPMVVALSCMTCQHRVRDARQACIANRDLRAGRYMDMRCARWEGMR